jgi:glycoprotein-N-acetylgalactosamine 3-beta-galactosyltransferase
VAPEENKRTKEAKEQAVRHEQAQEAHERQVVVEEQAQQKRKVEQMRKKVEAEKMKLRKQEEQARAVIKMKEEAKVQYKKEDAAKAHATKPASATTGAAGVITPDEKYQEFTSKGWCDAHAYCIAQGKQLCSNKDLCPEGIRKPPRHGVQKLDRFTPTRDELNTWLYVGDTFSERLCGTHEDCCGAKPGWGMIDGYPFAAIICCAGYPLETREEAAAVAQACEASEVEGQEKHAAEAKEWNVKPPEHYYDKASWLLPAAAAPAPGAEGKVLCFKIVPEAYTTSPQAQAVRDTWARRCDRLILFTTGSSNAATNAIQLPGLTNANADRWDSVHPAITYISQHYLDEFDWFLKTDDDTYVVVDNLRAYLKTLPSPATTPYYLGRRLFHVNPQYGHNWGGGYVLNKVAVQKLVAGGSVSGWKANGGACGAVAAKAGEGYTEGLAGRGGGKEGDGAAVLACWLHAAGVDATDTRDGEGRERFIPLTVREAVLARKGRGGAGYRWMWTGVGGADLEEPEAKSEAKSEAKPEASAGGQCSSRPVVMRGDRNKKMDVYMLEYMLTVVNPRLHNADGTSSGVAAAAGAKSTVGDGAGKLLCYIGTRYPLSPSIDVIKGTWSKKCDKIIFTTTHSDPQHGVVEIPGIISSSDANADHWQVGCCCIV